MRSAFFAALLASVNVLASSDAYACRSGPEPSELRDVRADAIVLAQIRNVAFNAEPRWRRWVATAAKLRPVLGTPAQMDFTFDDSGPGSCGPGQPSVDEYWVLYLKKEGKDFRVVEAWPFWWARASEDPRLSRLNTALPLGIVRPPSPSESKILDVVEKEVRLPNGATDVSNYTRVYSRASESWLRVELLRSRTPRVLVADISEEGPTTKSCGCKLETVVVDVKDLRGWGK